MWRVNHRCAHNHATKTQHSTIYECTLGSRLINGVAKKMSDYFFGRFADLVSPTNDNKKSDTSKNEKRVNELKSNFLNKYIYSAFIFLILILVAIFLFFSH